MQPVPRQNPHIKPYCRARKYLRSDAQWINVPTEVATDLVKQSRSAVIADLDLYQQVNGCYALPRMRVQEMLEVIDRCIEGIPYVPLDEANAQARGLGNMVAFWERMRNICPKVNTYYGPVYGKEGKQCVTSLDLDEAMLATRDFWFLAPTDYDNSWTPVLEVYEEQPSWPTLKPPKPKDFLSTLLHTKDSAPGPDGIPYSAWRLLPCVTVDAVISYFYDIIGGTALPPMQVGVWIPKAKAGPMADHFRPLGMPNTIDRLVDGSIAAYVMRHTAHLMHPSQAVMSYFKEPQKAVSCIQRILDGDSSACVLLADLSKAFERVNPYWILALLRIRKAPAWLIAYTKFVLFHRRVTHKVQGRLLPSRTLRQGVDMGRSFSVYLFCLAMDPLFTYLNQIPGVLAVQGYVDDTTIAGDGQDLAWIENVESCYQALQTAGFVIDPHACYFARVVINNRAFPRKCLSASVDAAWPGLLLTKPFPTAMAALLANMQRGYNTVLVRKGTLTGTPPNAQGLQQYHCIVAVYTFQQINEMNEGSHMHRLGSFATLDCACKSKSHILCNVALRSLALRRIEATRFGIQAIRSHAPSLGLALEGDQIKVWQQSWQIAPTSDEGAFLHQKCSDPKDVFWWITTLHEMVATDSHIEFGVEFPTRTWAMGCCSLSAQHVSLEKVLPLDYSTMLLPPRVGVCLTPVSRNAQVAVLPLQSPILSALRELERTGTNIESNVQLKLTRCSCGEYHMCITACRELIKGDFLVPVTGGDPQIIVQFDGSAHRASKVGGAGAALLQFDGNGLALLDWDARVLPKCADNIVAEANGADLAMHLYEKYVRMCHEQDLVPLPLSRIHGDIKQLLHHLDFRSRFRRSDLIPLINTFHRRRSRVAPNAITEFRPRETNVISDYLAGQASAWIRDNQHDPRCTGEPFSLPVDPPYELLLEANAVILGPHVAGKVMLILQETLGCNQLQLAACLRWNNGSHVAAIRSLALATRNATTPLTVEYVTPANDASGRLYATQICAQKLPRDLRLKETWIGEHVADPELLNEVKMVPIRIINSGATRALMHLTDKSLSIPSWIEAFAFDLDAAREVFTVHVRREGASALPLWPAATLWPICNQHGAMHLNTFVQDFNRLGLTQWEGIEEDVAWGHVTSLMGLARPSIDGPIFIYRAPVQLGGPSPFRVQLMATAGSSPEPLLSALAARFEDLADPAQFEPWHAPYSYIHASTDIGEVVDWITDKFVVANKGDLAVLHNRNKMVNAFTNTEWVSGSGGAIISRSVTSCAGMTAYLVLLAQTRVGFLSGGRGKRFHQLPPQEQAAQREEAYARATVALTRAQQICFIMGPLDMRGLVGAATIIGCLKYGACFSGQDDQDDPVFLIRLKDEDLLEAPDDSAFVQSLRFSCARVNGVYPPLALVEACITKEDSGQKSVCILSLSRGSKTKRLTSLDMSLDMQWMEVTFRVTFFGLYGQQNNPSGALMPGKAIGRIPVERRTPAAKSEVDQDMVGRDERVSDAVSDAESGWIDLTQPMMRFVTWPMAYTIDLRRYSRGVTSEDAAGVPLVDGQDKLQELVHLPRTWPLARLTIPLEGLSKQIDRLLEGYCFQILATNQNPEAHNGRVVQTATHLTWILAEYLADTIAWLMRSILGHDSKDPL
eukprot:symbB.v1.2.033388.t1/scaffold4123.1/size58836/8